ncbi:RNase H-like domain found in reverse transcriptase [Popillia japonica]|uniref:RNA-directed DNA polymerase n=1 Tax=Popillia japonica TaxID=7064 RepID=A0AAW1L7L2_POPJA
MLVLPRISSQPRLSTATSRVPGPPCSTEDPVGGRVRGRSTANTGTALATTAQPTQTATIHLRVGDREVLAHIDSAASQNLVKPGWTSGPTSKVAPIQFDMAIDQQTFLTDQMGTLEASASDYPFRCQAVIVPRLRADIILGHPWLQENSAVMDYGAPSWTTDQHAAAADHFRHRSGQATPPPAGPRPAADPPSPPPGVQPSGGTITTTSTTKHTIRLKDELPVRVQPYRYNPEKKRIISSQVAEMLAAGVIRPSHRVIRPSHSEYSSPVVIVTKKDGKPRFCVDYRRLNDKTRSEASPLPPIQESLRDLGRARIFSTLDLRSGYWQIRMDASSKQYTAFATPDGAAYEFNVMPFGLKNAPTTFQKLMAQDVLDVLVGYFRDFAIAYLDDIIIYSRDLPEHLRHLHQVLERLQQHGLRLNLEKCHFASAQLDYLGHVVTKEGNQPQTGHVNAIKAVATPTTRKSLRQFLGTVNWLRDYIPDASRIMAPLTDLLQVKTTFKWTESANAAFDALKTAASKPLFLYRPDLGKPFVLQTDASSIGAAAVLYQEEEGHRRIVSYSSLRFNKTEQRYHINEQECVAVIWAIRRYRPYLEDRPFLLRTDSKALSWLDGFRETKSKLMRWSLLLQEFQYTIEHVPGKDNQLPDALSRNPEDDTTPPALREADRLVPRSNTTTPERHPDQVFLVQEEEPLLHAIQDAQQSDPQVQNIIRRLQAGTPDQEFSFSRGFVRYKNGPHHRIAVPRTAQPLVLHRYHDDSTAGHPGIEETSRVITQRFHWPTIRTDIAEYIRGCRLCNAFKRGPIQAAAPLRPHAPKQPFEMDRGPSRKEHQRRCDHPFPGHHLPAFRLSYGNSHRQRSPVHIRHLGRSTAPMAVPALDHTDISPPSQPCGAP